MDGLTTPVYFKDYPEAARPIFVEATPENIEALAVAAIASNNPRPHLSADRLRDPLFMGILVYPPKVYEKIRELKNGNPSS